MFRTLWFYIVPINLRDTKQALETKNTAGYRMKKENGNVFQTGKVYVTRNVWDLFHFYFFISTLCDFFCKREYQ